MIMFRILEKFNILDITESVEKYGSGPFNRTYLASTNSNHNYILQLYKNDIIDRNIDFPHNSQIVINELEDKLNVELVNVDGENFAIVDDYFIRCYKINKGQVLFNKVFNEKMVFEMGKALGSFYKRTNSIPISDIKLTDTDYHNVLKRHLDLDMFVSEDLGMYLSGYNN